MGAARQSTVIPMRFGYLQLPCFAYVEANQKLLLLYSHFDQMLLWPYGDNVTAFLLPIISVVGSIEKSIRAVMKRR